MNIAGCDRFTVQWFAEDKFESGPCRVQLQRQMHRLAGCPQSVETTGLCRAASPRKHPAQIQLAVSRVKSSPHHPRRKNRNR